MLLFIEGYSYELDKQVSRRVGKTIREVLGDMFSIPKLEKKKDFKYVGYCYSHVAEDVVFFLPKVVLTDGTDTVFGATPQELVDFDEFSGTFEDGDERVENYKEFLSTLAIWIYRVLSVYNETQNDNILENKEMQTQSDGKKVKHNTLFDVIIALLDFNRENQDYLTFIARNTHSGNKNIQWTKTISKTMAVVQKGMPVYLNPVNRKKMVNFDEELLVIFYSILNYISEEHGFKYIKNLNYEVIKTNTIRNRYIKAGYGKRRLKEIKYKYFSDKALRIWDLCYAFFVRSHEIAINKSRQDCLMAKDFDIVFEKMIDELIGETNLPKELVEQKDGKIVDHLFLDRGLIESVNGNAHNTYYIGDSKYYKRQNPENVHLDKTSIYKQYTYAKNIVQWNVDLFLGLNDGKYKQEGHHQLRDELTEGYNPIPNFFISAHIRGANEDSNKLLAFDDERITQQQRLNLNRQFENRLFDRDTMLLSHYDVNFLFIVALYGRNKKSAQAAWRSKVREQFRKEIQTLLNGMYSFHVLQPKAKKNCYGFVKKYFSVLNGKVYRPYPEANYLVLAELKSEPTEKKIENLWKEAKVSLGSEEETSSYEKVKKEMEDYFDITRNVEINADGGFTFKVSEDIGNFHKIEKLKANVYIGYVGNPDVNLEDFKQHKAKYYKLKKLPKVNLLETKYLAPMVKGCVDGFYNVIGISVDDGCLVLKLGDYIPFGTQKANFYRSIQPTELQPMEYVKNLYKKLADNRNVN